ncbi:MAG TPA: phosphopentomutase [Vicinamibacterales bacterium]
MTSRHIIPNLTTFPRVVLIVLDSVGCGELPDAGLYGDEGSDTLGNIARHVPLRVPRLRALGLGRVARITPPVRPEDGPSVAGAYGRMAEASAGKDSVTGHWEMMGIVLDRPFPTFPRGFPASVIAEFESRIGRGILGNVVASGTEIIDRLGAEHVQTGKPIVYTSADSVFQIAAHEDVVPVPELYRMCEVAFDLVGRGMGVGRVIARPFVGSPGAFKRTSNRHDYALDPIGQTLLDHLALRGIPVVSIGKVKDLFAGRGITTAMPTASDAEGIDRVLDAMKTVPEGLIFANLVDFDTVYGHRNDVAGYAANIERFDDRLGAVLDQLRDTDLLVITADHGNDPTTPSTDHSREHVPLLMTGRRVKRGVDVGTRSTFADLGQTLAANFSVGPLAHGTSFLEDVVVEHS